MRETLKAKGYDLDENLRKLLERLADGKPVVPESGKDRPEVTILKIRELKHDGDLMKSKEVVRTLVERIPEEVLRRTTIRNKRVTLKEEVEHLGLDQESGEWPQRGRDGEEENLSGESEEWDDGSEESDDEQDSLCTILPEENMRYHDRELQTHPSSGTYSLEHDDAYGGEELERIAVSRKPLRELSCNSNIRTNLLPEDDREVLKNIVCVKLKDDIHNSGELNGQMMALKEHVKARYRLSDLIGAQKNDEMRSKLSKWIRTGVKRKGDLDENSYKIFSQFYEERKELLYHTADGVVVCRRKDEEKIIHKHNFIILPQLYQTEVLFRSHDQMGHQGIDKVQQRILHRFDWPGLRKAC